MERVYKYSVLMCIPNRRRGERVNVGLIVYGDSGIDVHLPEIAKIKLITGKNWSSYLNNVLENLKEKFETLGDSITDGIEGNFQIDPAFDLSRSGRFVSRDESDYASMVKEILENLVITPKFPRARHSEKRINTEIAELLRRRGLLASGDETPDSHKVFRNQSIEDGLNADFAQKNGAWRCTATLDLRSPPSNLKDASLKAITLDRAKVKYGDTTICIGVYAANSIADTNVMRHINLMAPYSAKMFNWQDDRDRQKLIDFYAQALDTNNYLI